MCPLSLVVYLRGAKNCQTLSNGAAVGGATAELEEIKHEGKSMVDTYLTSLAGKTEPAVREKTASGGLGA